MLREVIRKWWRVELAFADPKGYVLDHAEGKVIPPNNDFCRMALFSKEGFRRCNDSVKLARDKLRGITPRAGRRCIVHECHLGFDVIACPIVLDGEFAGFLFVGGSVHGALDDDATSLLMRKIREVAPAGGNGDDLQAAVARIPELSGEEIGQLCDLLELGADEIQNYHAELKLRERELTSMTLELGERYRFENIVGNSRAMQSVFRLLEKIIESESTVLIQGESGTGKELVARAIHYNGPRAKRAFVVQNCSAFNDNLLESALFGHTRGSFTGAIKDKKGLFEIADGGTFFLDEVGDMSPSLQVKLLRVLQEGTFTPVGGTETREVDVRVIAATHKDLQKMVERGEFREDLYYRINVIKIQIPPLRERIDDLPILCEHFLRKHFRARPGSGRVRPPKLAPDALLALQRYSWPGNIRELENEIERCMVLGGDVDELPEDLLSQRVRDAALVSPKASARHDHAGSLKDAVERVERELIHHGLIRTHWNKSQLAKDLGISRSNLIMKVERYGLDKKTV
ncbi:MAG TPA: sigma 54-interacting transcriptional regulator [Polyangia bacterium]|nr:sigma 54-interacting transcriptional regulator [Polyangia bacterium]